MPFSTWQSDILHLFKRLNALREKKIIKNFAIQYIILTCTSCKEIWVNICVIQIHIFFTCIFPLTHKQYTLVSLGGRQPGLRPSITILWSFYKRKNNAKKNRNSAEWIKFVPAPLVAYCTDEKNTGISNLRSNLLPENDIKKQNKKIWSSSHAKSTSPD